MSEENRLDDDASRIWLFILRLAMGWVMFYAGITKVLNPDWSAAGYLKGAKTLTGFFQSLTDPGVLPTVNFLNEWGLTLLGVSLILGIGVRLSSILGAILMLLYYFPVLTFPMIGINSYIIDNHIIYASVLAYFASIRAGRFWGLDTWCANLPICKKYPPLHQLWG